MVIFVVCVVLGIWYFTSKSASNSLKSGEVHDHATGKPVRPGDTDTAMPASDLSAATPPNPSAPGVPLQLQIAGQNGADTQAATPAQYAPQSTFAPPASDSIDRNPPDGMRFAGSGRYEVYRQGDLTYRINTVTGKECVLFATDSEWRKPRVYRNGCAGKS